MMGVINHPVSGAFSSYSYAFQPIVDMSTGAVFSYEALIRGPGGQSAAQVFAGVSQRDLHRFDRESRLYALRMAGELGLDCHINLNVLPRGVNESSADLGTLLDTAEQAKIPADRLVLEITESEAIDDHARFGRIIDEYRGAGIKIAIDDVGAGYAGLNLLADFQPDMIKLDMSLVRSIESRGPRQSIARALTMVCNDLGIDVIAEGVETVEELTWFENEGIRLFQGYLFGQPEFEQLPILAFTR